MTESLLRVCRELLDIIATSRDTAVRNEALDKARNLVDAALSAESEAQTNAATQGNGQLCNVDGARQSTPESHPAVAAPTQPPAGDTPMPTGYGWRYLVHKGKLQYSTGWHSDLHEWVMAHHFQRATEELAAAKSDKEFFDQQGRKYAKVADVWMKRARESEKSLAALQSLIKDAGKELPPEPIKSDFAKFDQFETDDYIIALEAYQAALSVKCAEMEKDAARYRFLVTRAHPEEFFSESTNKSQIDCEIDAARREA